MAAKKKDKESVSKITDKKAKEEALKKVVGEITKDYGEGSIMKLGDRKNINVEVIPTGSINLDEALGVKGFPKGRIIEIYGAESSGKTTLTLHAIAECQKQGGVAAFIDAEHALDPVYAKALGVNIDELLISQPDSGEQALEIAEMLLGSAAVDLIVVDSVAALVPRSELEGEMSDMQMGLQARLMSKGLRKLTSVVSKTDSVLIFINQIREKIGGFGGFGGAPATTTSGGRALKFFSTVRVEIKKVGTIKQGDDAVGSEVIAKVIKNKVAAPFREARFAIMYGKGISRSHEILEKAIELKICKKSGSWFSYGDLRLGQGQINVENKLDEDVKLREEIYGKVLAELNKQEETEEKKQANKTAGKSKSKAKAKDEELEEDTIDLDLEDIDEEE